MDENGLSEAIKRELEEITKRKGHLLKPNSIDKGASFKIMEEFLKASKGDVPVKKDLLSAILLISNYLINENISDIFKKIDLPEDEKLIFKLYLFLQMSNNFLDGFYLGYAFVKVLEEKDILNNENLNILSLFEKIYILRRHGIESLIVHLLDEDLGLIKHFEKSYRELFTSNSILLTSLAQKHTKMIINYLMLSFFDGILTARIIAEGME